MTADPGPADRSAAPSGPDDDRTAELRAGLAAVRRRIDAACAAAGRDPAGVTLVVVTKTYGADDVRRLAGLGVREVGESRDQEAAPKAARSTDLALRWHFVGRLQSNKARSVARYAHAVHSVDRAGLVTALERGAQAAGRTVDVFLQASLDDDPGRGGAPAAKLPALAEAVAASGALRLRGLMAVAPQDADPARAFATLAGLAERLRADHPQATALSAGMSGDLEAAVPAGATHLRVGSAVLGARPPVGYVPHGG